MERQCKYIEQDLFAFHFLSYMSQTTTTLASWQLRGDTRLVLSGRVPFKLKMSHGIHIFSIQSVGCSCNFCMQKMSIPKYTVSEDFQTSKSYMLQSRFLFKIDGLLLCVLKPFYCFYICCLKRLKQGSYIKLFM